MRLSDFDYQLPAEAIAQEPIEPRDASRLLVLDRKTGDIEHARFRDLPGFLRAGDLLVLNNTRVTAMKIIGRRPSGGRVEALVLSEKEPGIFECLVRPARRLGLGAEVQFENFLSARVVGVEDGGTRILRFEVEGRGGRAAIAEQIRKIGRVPLPPYFKGRLQDSGRYQTVFAKEAGSAAAPTAGLHFTVSLLEKIRKSGVDLAWVTLDIGLDTFRPVSEADALDHKIHGEQFSVPQETASKVSACCGRIIAVGTTSVRALEAAATGKRRIKGVSGVTNLYITPGYEFKVVDGMVTNFHMPRTTMLLLVSALCDREKVMRAYQVALEAGYRFLSFGDSMLIIER